MKHLNMRRLHSMGHCSRFRTVVHQVLQQQRINPNVGVLARQLTTGRMEAKTTLSAAPLRSTIRSTTARYVVAESLPKSNDVNGVNGAHNDADRDGTNSKESVAPEDPDIIFSTVWNNLVTKYGDERKLVFPKDVMWLAGAPGAGKGRMTPFIQQHRGITSKPLEVSTLLISEEMQKLKSEGHLVSDRHVIELLFDALLAPQYRSGVIVDGFPRTRIQAECIKKLYDKTMELRRKFEGSDLFTSFRRPIFHITVLFVEEEESIRRQLRRGEAALKHNAVVKSTGVGELQAIRKTDASRDLARTRYREFRDQVFASLQSIKDKFHFHFINAEGSVEEVQARIIKELEYQSSMELGDSTFEKVRQLPLASEVIQNARHELVKRLDHYQLRNPEVFDLVLQVLQDEFIDIIKRQAIAGKAIIRSENGVFLQPQALDMALDLLSERGYRATLDVQRRSTPHSIDISTGRIILKQSRVYEFQIEFPRPTIRRGV